MTNALQIAAGQPLLALAIDALIHANSGNNKATLSSRAQTIKGIFDGLGQIASGNAAVGLATVTSSMNTSALTPGEKIAVGDFVATLANQISLVQGALPGGALVSAVNAAIANQCLQTIDAVCAAYIEVTVGVSSTSGGAVAPGQ